MKTDVKINFDINLKMGLDEFVSLYRLVMGGDRTLPKEELEIQDKLYQIKEMLVEQNQWPMGK